MADKKQKKNEPAAKAAKTDAAANETDGKNRSAAAREEPVAGEATAPEGMIPFPEIGGELARVTAERDDYLDHLRRLKAEWENYRKRVQRDNGELRLRAAEVVVESLLPVMDNMGRALQAAARHEDAQILVGLELVSSQLRGTLEGHGLEEVPVETGTLFDPNLHEAVMTQVSDEHAEGTVLLVLERGYLLHGRLLRPAKVIVSRAE